MGFPSPVLRARSSGRALVRWIERYHLAAVRVKATTGAFEAKRKTAAHFAAPPSLLQSIPSSNAVGIRA
jgi:hypothetical protein